MMDLWKRGIENRIIGGITGVMFTIKKKGEFINAEKTRRIKNGVYKATKKKGQESGTEGMEEHSAGGSQTSNDMQDLIECANNTEMEDIKSTGLFLLG
ncbi:hypothetical protein Tco_0187879 [Tanacetum coccineum]